MVIDFSTSCTCVSHASDVLGAFVMITSVLHSCRLNAGERNMSSFVQRGLVCGLFWHLGKRT
jgi:hypothetical protein